MKHRDIKNLGVQRAYATFAVENVKEAGPGRKRTFTGIASTIETDLMEDIVVPEGAEFKLPLPLLYGHDSGQPIGWVRAARVKKDRIEVDCEVADVDEADSPELKKELAKRWTQLKSGLVRGLSIGFNPIETAQIDGSWGLKFLKWKWLELSAVVIAANQGSGVLSIKQIKSLSKQHLAALGREGSPPGDGPSPGASGQHQQAASGRLFSSRSQKGKDTMKTLKELLELQATRVARQTEITKAWEDQDHERTDEERAELREIDAELTKLDDEILMTRMHQRHAASASEVRGANSEEGSRSRVPGGMSFVRKTDPEDKFPGQSFTRRLIARAAAFCAIREGNYVNPADIAAKRWGKTHPNLVQVIRAAVAGGGTGSGEWGAELAQSDERYTGDFITFLYSKTIFDKLPLREVPARINVKGQDGAATGYWVGENRGIPVSKPDFSSVELTPLKVAALAVCSKELLSDSTPAAEMFIRDSIAEASAQKVDTTFLSSDAASAGVSPAGLLNGVSALSPSGTDEAAVRADMQALAYPFVTAKMASGLMFVMNPAQGLALGSFVNTFSQPAFPGINENGGTFMGRTALTGDNVTAGDIILLRPQDIWKIGDTGIEVSMSDQATIEQDSAPQGAGDTPTAASATLMSLWQTEQVGFKVVRRINFQKRRTGAVQVISNAEYGGVTS